MNFLNIYVPPPDKKVLDVYKDIPKWYESDTLGPVYTKGLTSEELLRHIENKMYNKYDAETDINMRLLSVAKAISLVFHSILTTHTYDFAPTVLHYPKQKNGEFVTLAISWFNPLTGKYHVLLKHKTRELWSMFFNNRVINVYHMGVLKNHVLIAPVDYTITEQEVEEDRLESLSKSLLYMIKGYKHGVIIPMDKKPSRSVYPRYNKYSADNGRVLKTMTGINIQNIKESIRDRRREIEMANICTNVLKMPFITTKPLFRLGVNDRIEFDFNEVVQMPPAIRDTVAGTKSEEAMLFATDTLKKFLENESLEKCVNGEDIMKFDTGLKLLRNIAVHGHPTWYDWSRENWSVKWNATDTKICDRDTIVFNTPWCPPDNVLIKLSEMYPDDPIELYYKDEFDESWYHQTIEKGKASVDAFVSDEKVLEMLEDLMY